MIDAAALIAHCRALGARLIPDGNRLKVQAPQPLPDDLVATLKTAKSQVLAELRRHHNVAPLIWKGLSTEYRSLLVVRKAELVAATAQLTGNPTHDWYIHNSILNLERQISDITRWLAEADQRELNP